MYFFRTKEEIHLSFKNSEKQQTQALNEIKHDYIYIYKIILKNGKFTNFDFLPPEIVKL